MEYTKDEILVTHPLWKSNIKRWKFYIHSFIGGQDYKQGEYLTAYMQESMEDYEARLDSTPLDNHVKNVVSIYNSFLFRQSPNRQFGTLEGDPGVQAFLEDADLEGRSFNTVMRDISTYASIYGHCWCILDKPAVQTYTRAEELDQGIRPYVTIYTPENVLDWQWAREFNGTYRLVYLKVFEGDDSGMDLFRIYTPEKIQLIALSRGDTHGKIIDEVPNSLGQIPAVCVYSQRSSNRGIGISDVADVADMQRSIANELSEVEQIIRLTNHPSLVKTADTNAAAGAGAIIQMPHDLPEGLKPYLLQPTGASIDSLLGSITHKVLAIDRMTYMGGIRSIESRRLSGIALATEFQLLNARLSEKGDYLEHSEEQLWRLFALWQGTVWTGMVKYPDSFNIQDRYNDVVMYKTVLDSKPTNPVLVQEVERLMLTAVIDDSRKLSDLLEDFDERAEETTEAPDEEKPVEQAAVPETRYYPDGEAIPADLPPAYQLASNEGVPEGQNCANCEYYNPDNQQCAKWNNAKVREIYWCAKWEPVEEESEEDEESELTAEQIKKIQDMLMDGMTNQEIMAAMPGITVEDIVYAAAEAARNN